MSQLSHAGKAAAFLKKEVSFFTNLYAKGSPKPFGAILSAIRSKDYQSLVEAVRDCEKGSEAQTKAKSKLPCFTASAITNGGHNTKDALSHSGVLQIDLDNVEGQPSEWRNRLGADPHIAAAFISPSGTGVKCFMLISADIATHKESFKAAKAYFLSTYDLKIDKCCKDVSRLCYVSHDPDLVVNEKAVPLKVKLPDAGQVSPSNTHSLTPPLYPLCPPHSSLSFICITNPLFTNCPQLKKHYSRLVIAYQNAPQKGQRNHILVEMIPRLFFALSEKFVVQFSEVYFEQFKHVFEDYPKDLWKREAEDLLKGCMETYITKELNPHEREKYSALKTEDERAAFRIARSLSACTSEGSLAPPLFFLSCHELGGRLGLFDPEAQRILKRFIEMGILDLEQKGEQGCSNPTKGKRRASIYRWKLGSPQLSSQPFAHA